MGRQVDYKTPYRLGGLSDFAAKLAAQSQLLHMSLRQALGKASWNNVVPGYCSQEGVQVVLDRSVTILLFGRSFLL